MMGMFYLGCLIWSEAICTANVARVTEGLAFIALFDVDELKLK